VTKKIGNLQNLTFADGIISGLTELQNDAPVKVFFASHFKIFLPRISTNDESRRWRHDSMLTPRFFTTPIFRIASMVPLIVTTLVIKRYLTQLILIGGKCNIVACTCDEQTSVG